jgi:hypothetical protein
MEEVYRDEIMPHDAGSYYLLFRLAMDRASSAIAVKRITKVETTPNSVDFNRAVKMLSLTPLEAGISEAQLQDDFRQALINPDSETFESVGLLVGRAVITLSKLACDLEVSPGDLDSTDNVIRNLRNYYADQHPLLTN